MVQETIIADLRKHGFELVSVAEPDLMANDPARILIQQMMGAVAQCEKSQIVLTLRGARMRKRAKEGGCEGWKPFGYYEDEAARTGTDEGATGRRTRVRRHHGPDERRGNPGGARAGRGMGLS